MSDKCNLIKNLIDCLNQIKTMKGSGLDCIKSHIFENIVESFQVTQENEFETATTLMLQRPPLSISEELKHQKIYYISDIHLWHKLNNAKCKSWNDAVYDIQKIIDNLLNHILPYETFYKQSIILIGGDTASDFSLFTLFVKMLRKSINIKELDDIPVVFLLGNHELWDFCGTTLDEIIEKYRTLLHDNGMYLLQNNLLIKFDENRIEQVGTDELNSISRIELNNRIGRARVILFGGLAFSGYNEEFNAKQGIYGQTIDREEEIKETKKFANLYDKICDFLPDKRVIVFTHTPQKDWYSQNALHKNYVYVNGHTHRNYFYDDGDYRIYADNQIGYHKNDCFLKQFYLEDDYDIFADYEDGIYEITRDDYKAFNRGKHISITFRRKFSKLYMLKRNGYYMFILESKNGHLNLLNGGFMKGLENSINYYYENMDKVISHIKTPLEPYYKYQKQIADKIKSIGGRGFIHGAIIDIDFLNHIYVNPLDSTLTPYFAYDMLNKVVFRDVETLLQENCPELYAKYLDLLQGDSSAQITFKNTKSKRKHQLYLDTDIYSASREIKKMQKLYSNILSVWIEPQSLKITD